LPGSVPITLAAWTVPRGNEDERPGQTVHLPLPHQEEELPLEDVEQLITAVVNMARWPGPGAVVASINPIEPPVCSPVALNVMPPMVRPSPGLRMIPSGAFAP